MKIASISLLKCVAVIVLLIGIVTAVNASPITTVDQQNLGVGTGTNGGATFFGQSFTPAISGIDAIEFLMGGFNDLVTVDILDGIVGLDGLSGTVIATSNPLIVNNTSGFHEIFHFDFPSTVTLIPGHTYVARLFSSEGIGGVSHMGDSYTGGQFLHQGFDLDVFSSRDMIFTEGIHSPIPEPAAAWLFCFGLFVLFGTHKLRRI